MAYMTLSGPISVSDGTEKHCHVSAIWGMGKIKNYLVYHCHTSYVHKKFEATGRIHQLTEGKRPVPEYSFAWSELEMSPRR